jgi:hypothetical protein
MPRSRSPNSLTRKFIHTCNVHAVILAPRCYACRGNCNRSVGQVNYERFADSSFFPYLQQPAAGPILGHVTEFYSLTNLFTIRVNINIFVPPSPTDSLLVLRRKLFEFLVSSTSLKKTDYTSQFIRCDNTIASNHGIDSIVKHYLHLLPFKITGKA